MKIIVSNALLCALSLLSIPQVVESATITYKSPSVIVDNVNGVTQLSVVDVSFDGSRDILTAGPNRLTSIIKGSDGKFAKPVSFAKFVRGGEAVDFLNGAAKGAGSMVVACSRSNKGSKPLTGAIQLVKDNGRGNAPTVKSLVGSTSFAGRTTRIAEANGHDVKVADIDKDGKMDILATISGTTTANTEGGYLLQWRNRRQDKFQLTVIDETLNGKAVFETGDFDNDGRMDIAVLAMDEKKLLVYYQAANGGFDKVVVDTKVAADAAITTGRFTSDSRDDIFLLGQTTLTGYVANEGRKFTKTSMFTFDASAHVDKNFRNFQLKLHDVDGDNKQDVVLVYGKQNGVRWMKQLPQNKLASPAILVNIKAPTSFDIQKMDGDNISDIVAFSSTDSKIYQALAVSS